MPPLPSLTRQPLEDPFSAPLSAFEAETSAAMRRIAPWSENAIVWSAVAMIALAIGLTSVVKLDRIVSGGGKIVPTEGSLFVQPLDRSVVHEIKVEAGQVVKKGEVLATLDPTFATADFTQLQQKTASAKALVARLEAERDGQPYAPKDGNPYEQLQARYYQQRQNEYGQSVADFDARIRSDQSALASAERDANMYSQRVDYASKVETMESTLEQHGNGSKLKTLSATDSLTEMARLLSGAKNTANQTQHDIASLQAQRQVFIDHWHSDVASNLVDARNALNQTQEDLTKATKVHELIALASPEDAVVLKIADASVGSVVDSHATQPLFTLTPLTGPLEAQVRIPAEDNAFLAPGEKARIKLDAYEFRRHGTAQGVIKTISDGSFTQDDDGNPLPPFFKATVEITDTHLTNVPASFRLIPGMTLTADVLTGKRTMLSYLTEPLYRTGAKAMREP